MKLALIIYLVYNVLITVFCAIYAKLFDEPIGECIPFLFASYLYYSTRLKLYQAVVFYIFYVTIFPIPCVITLIYWLWFGKK